MLKKILLKSLSKHASKWLVLFIDLVLISFCFILTYYIRFIDSNFDYSILLSQLPIVVLVALFSFLLVGSYKGIIRHTGT
ncbi:MAG: polysaccharide biosynthesis protein, partial [Polaribacter sp.]